MTRTRLSFGGVSALALAAAIGGAAATRPAENEPKNRPAAPPAAAADRPATLQEVARIRGFIGFAFCTYSPDSRVLATCDGERQFHFWDLVTFQERACYDSKPRYESVDVNRCRYSPDGKTFVVYGHLPVPQGANRKPEVTLLDAASGKERTHFPGENPVICPAGKVLAVRRGEAVALLDIDTGREVRTLPVGPPGKSRVPHLFSPDGSLLFTAGPGGQSRLWEVATGRELARIEGYDPAFAKAAPVLATILPGSGRAWAERGDEPAEPPFAGGPVVKIWDTVSGKEKAAVRGFEAPGVHIGLAPDGRRLLTSPWHLDLAADGTWETPQPAPPDGGQIGHLEVRLWDTATGREQVRLPGRVRYPHDAFFLPDGKAVIFSRLAGAGEADELAFWDVEKQTVRLALQCGDGITRPRFSADGSMVVAVFRDTQSQAGPLGLRFWETATGEEWVSDVDGGRFQIVASMYTNFSPDGTMMTVPVPQGEMRLLKRSARPLKRVILGKPAEPPKE
jgi:WD40 repeat protein